MPVVIDEHTPVNPSRNNGRLYDGPWLFGTEIHIADPEVATVSLYVHQCPFCGKYHLNRPQYRVCCPDCAQMQGNTVFVL